MGEIGEERVPELVDALMWARHHLLRMARRLDEGRWAHAPSPRYSPVGWHLGHVAAVQARWLGAGEVMPGELLRLFDPAQTEKARRSALPAPRALLGLLETSLGRATEAVRRRQLPEVAGVPGLPADYLLRFAVQHELQHAEHVAVIAALLDGQLQRARPREAPLGEDEASRWVGVHEGCYVVGATDRGQSLDCEWAPHPFETEGFRLMRAPVTVAAFGGFVADGGYGEARLWHPEGWTWRVRERIEAPLGWVRVGGQAGWAHPDGRQARPHPVVGVSWYEADAFARWRKARLPTEAEWEAAAGGAARRFPTGERTPTPLDANVEGAIGGTTPVGSYPDTPEGLCDLCGNVWEWTASWFEPYPGFRPYPYAAYSVPWFGGTHRVMRGGSWATPGPLCRTSFRNWYEPTWRELPVGFRCAG